MMLIILILSFVYYVAQPIQTQKTLYVPKGSINKIITQFQEKNYNLSKIDSLLLRFLGTPQNGWISFESTLQTRGDFLYKLTKAKALTQKVTIIPGETTYFILREFAKKYHFNLHKLIFEFKKQAPIQEGAFFAETYYIPKGLDEKRFIQLLLELSQKNFKKISLKYLGYYKQKKFLPYIVIASIIEKEAASIKEMSLISSVIYNRLKKGMKLQMDGTLNYGKYSHTKVTAYRIRHDKSMFNTYKYSSLPSVPICNTGRYALVAALRPQKSNYLYFMRNKNGTHDFTCYYSTHLKNIKRATK